MLTNLFAAIPPSLPAELTETLLANSTLRIERIISHGQASPPGYWYDQTEHEWVLLLQGAARLRIKAGDDTEQIVPLQPGDFLHLPAHERHRVDWTAPAAVTIWLAVFYADC